MNRIAASILLLSLLGTLPVPEALAAKGFMIENRAQTPIAAVYLINESERSDNLIADSATIPSGAKSLVSRAPWPGCTHDVIVFMSDDRAGYFTKVNTCKDTVVVLEDILEIRD